jgi:hypothetical protein
MAHNASLYCNENCLVDFNDSLVGLRVAVVIDLFLPLSLSLFLLKSLHKYTRYVS